MFRVLHCAAPLDRPNKATRKVKLQNLLGCEHSTVSGPVLDATPTTREAFSNLAEAQASDQHPLWELFVHVVMSPSSTNSQGGRSLCVVLIAKQRLSMWDILFKFCQSKRVHAGKDAVLKLEAKFLIIHSKKCDVGRAMIKLSSSHEFLSPSFWPWLLMKIMSNRWSWWSAKEWRHNSEAPPADQNPL